MAWFITESIRIKEKSPPFLYPVKRPIQKLQENQVKSKTILEKSSQPKTDFPNMPLENLDIPIAVRKSSRSCTSRPLYPTSKFVSYRNLSSSFSAFTSQLSRVEIPKTVQDALKVQKQFKML